MKLRKNQFCPIHRSRFCCGRGEAGKQRRLRPGVERIEDPNHLRGYREIGSPAEMQRLLSRKVTEQDRKCGICHEPFTDATKLFPTTSSPKAWARLGETIIPTTFKRPTGSAICSKGQYDCPAITRPPIKRPENLEGSTNRKWL